MKPTILTKIENELIKSGLRTEWDLRRKLKSIDKGELFLVDIGMVKRRKVSLLYQTENNPKFLLHEFSLPLPKKVETLYKNLKLKEWKENIGNEVISVVDNKQLIEYIRVSILAWVTENQTNENHLKQFVESLRVTFSKGNLCFIYKELNGTDKKVLLSIKKHEQYSLEELYTLANNFSQKHWSRNFDGEIKIVGYRWAATLGTFDRRTNLITFSKVVNGRRSKAQVEKTLLHELVHWHLFTTGKPYRDIHDEFIEECLRVGANISMASDAQIAYRNYCKRKGIEVDKKYA